MIGDIFQPTHLLFLLVVVLLVLGPKRLPEVAKSLGRGMRDFKDAISSQDGGAMHQPIPPVPPVTEEHPPEPQPVSVAAPAAEPQTPVSVAASAAEPQTEAAPESQPAGTPEPERVASQASKDPGEGTS